MKGDFTRNTFDPLKHFSRVLMQQGRVQLDADWNEQMSILLHYLRALAEDIIGRQGGPVDYCGFEIKPYENGKGDFTIGPGRYYVDGILCENDTGPSTVFILPEPLTESKKTDLKDDQVVGIQQKLSKGAVFDRHPFITYLSQPDYPVPEPEKLASGNYLIYLDVWERHITPIEDDTIREIALGGPETCTRAKVVWQVKALKDVSCADALNKLVTISKARLTARVDPGQTIKDACVTSPESKYRGPENQLYRVEIHDRSESGSPTFKWSRENGSIVTAWLGTSGYDLKVSNARGFEAGNWVELSDDTMELRGQHGLMVKLAKGEGDTLSVDPGTVQGSDALAWQKDFVNPKVRRWDQKTAEKGTIPVEENEWLDLEDGIQIQFSSGGEYRTGDYWLIPARVSTGNIEWPFKISEGNRIPDALPPHGIAHHYAPLATINMNQEGKATPIVDCRCRFSRLTCSYGYQYGDIGIGVDLIGPE